MLNKVIGVLDIGTSTVKCAAIIHKKAGHVEVIGYYERAMQGLAEGQIIVNQEQFEASLLTALDELEKTCGYYVQDVVINIDGLGLSSKIIKSGIKINVNKEISKLDVERLKKLSLRTFLQKNKSSTAIDVAVLDYVLNDFIETTSPAGMFASKVVGRFNITAVNSQNLSALIRYILRCRVNVIDVLPSIFGSAASCLTQDGLENENNILLIEIGAGNTKVGICRSGFVIFNFSIPIGGRYITRQISKNLNVTMSDAERLKNVHGSLLEPYNADTTISLADEPEELNDFEIGSLASLKVTTKSLRNSIKAAVEDIYAKIVSGISAGGYKNSFSEVALTGGGANLGGLIKFSETYFSKSARLVEPIRSYNINCLLQKSCYSTLIGMINIVSSKKYSLFKTNMFWQNYSLLVKKVLYFLRSVLRK